MKNHLNYLLIFILLFSCGKKHDDGAISMSIEQRDSLLIEYIAKEFYDDYNPEISYSLPRQRDFRKQLNYLRVDTGSTHTHEANFKDYRLKSFLFDPISSRPPFAIEITNGKDEFINFFSFTDEDFYRSNSIDVKTYIKESINQDSVLFQKINLEKNINELIQRLGIKKEEDISKFNELIFTDLLFMKKVTKDTIQTYIDFYFKRSNLNDSIRKYVDNEMSTFLKQGKNNVLMVLARDGGPGYWRIWAEKNKDIYVVKSAFFSDLLYKAYFM